MLMGYGLASSFTKPITTFQNPNSSLISSPFPGPTFPSITKFLARFLGCGYKSFDLTLEISPPTPSSGPISSKSDPNFGISQLQNFSFLITTPAADRRKIFNLYKSQLLSLSPSKNKNAWLSIILLLSGDLQQNPGPRSPKAPCGICKKACTYKTPAVACDNCNVWYHTRCMAMNSSVYRALHNVSWYCCSCQFHNFSSGLFIDTINDSSTPNFDSLFNPFDSLSPSRHSRGPNSFFDPSSTPNKPLFTSTPDTKKGKFKNHPTRITIQNLSILNINFQSLWNKRVELSNLASDTKSDIIIGTETWLHEDIKNLELLLNDYDIQRRDRPTRGGGVLIAIKNPFLLNSFRNQKILNPSLAKLS